MDGNGINDALLNVVPNVEQVTAQNIAVTLNNVCRTKTKKIKLKINSVVKRTYKFITLKLFFLSGTRYYIYSILRLM